MVQTGNFGKNDLEAFESYVTRSPADDYGQLRFRSLVLVIFGQDKQDWFELARDFLAVFSCFMGSVCCCGVDGRENNVLILHDTQIWSMEEDISCSTRNTRIRLGFAQLSQ